MLFSSGFLAVFLQLFGVHLKASSIGKPAFASAAGGLRYWNGAAFASFKKFASHFLNPAFGVTKPKEAPYPITGKSGRLMIEA